MESVKTKKRIDRNRIIENASILEVAEYIGMTTSQERSGKRVKCLCPSHNDKNLGSCFLYTDQNTYYCFACGAKGNVIDIVMDYYKWNRSDGQRAREAMCIVAAATGMTDVYADINNAPKYYGKVPPNEDLEFIGLSGDAPFWVDYLFRTIPDGATTKSGYMLNKQILWEEHPMVLQSSRPLRALLKDDKDTFLMLIKNKCDETIVRYVDLMERMKRPNPESEKDRYILNVIKVCGYSALMSAIQQNIERARKIKLEYGFQ